MSKKNYNSFVVLKQSDKDPKHWGILNIVPISFQPNEHEDAAEARARRESYKKMAGWLATMPGASLRVAEATTNSCQPVNNFDGFPV